MIHHTHISIILLFFLPVRYGKSCDGRPGKICMYDGNWSGVFGNRSGQNPNRSAPGRGEVMHLSGGGRGGKIPGNEDPESVTKEN